MIKLISFLISIFIVVQINGQNFTLKQKIVAADREEYDQFGSVSISGDYAIVGACFDDNSTLGGKLLEDAGAAYIYERNSKGLWNQVQKIVASDRRNGDNFGASVAISGNYAIVGSPYDDEDTSGGNYIWNAGSAYIYERNSNGVWNQVQKIIASDRRTTDWFGKIVSIESNCAMVSSPRNCYDENEQNIITNTGAVFIFERDLNGSWEQKQKIVASDRSKNDWFSNSTSINDNFAIIAAPAKWTRPDPKTS